MGPHSHAADELAIPDRTRTVLTAVAAGLAVLTIVGMVLLRPTGDDRPDLSSAGFGGSFYDATVVALDEQECPGEGTFDAEGNPVETESQARCALVSFRLLGGPDEGDTVEQELFDLDSLAPISEGDKVVLRFDPNAGEGFEYQYTGDRQRKPALFWLAVLFAAVVVLLGRLRGLAALAGLAASLVILLAFILPAIIDGRPPLLVAVVGSVAIAFLALYLAHGFSPMTTVALLGTAAALVVTLVLGVVFVEAAAFSGLTSEDAFFLQVGGAQIDLEGLILAGIVIGALGAIDDMTVTQASAVWELHAANPSRSRRSLYGAAMQIGRDHVASTVNTLVLAYAGASMPLLLLFVLGTQSLGTVANSEIVAVEIVRTLVGSIGLVTAVPITTWLAALVAPQADQRRGRRRAGRRSSELDRSPRSSPQS
jgi:uncharacterized membrane protein